MINLTGKVALVTGASRGIGRACAIKLAGLGAKVVVNYNKNAAAAEQVVAETKQKGGDAIAVPFRHAVVGVPHVSRHTVATQ
jgi:3-oxoacyl-[acyl-carrier protein] reductase